MSSELEHQDEGSRLTEADRTTLASEIPLSQTVRAQESILVVDCGSTTTKAVLLDVVEGQYRFLAYGEAPSTAHAPWSDVSIGVVDVLRQLEETTKRTLFGSDGQLIIPEDLEARGVDRFLVITSAAEPLQVILVGLVRDVSLASARRAALSTHTVIEDVISVEHDPTTGQAQTLDDKINAIWHSSPDVICVVGGTDSGSAAPVLEMVQGIVRVALYLMGDKVPPVIYAGNSRLRETVAKRLGEVTSLRTVDNVRPQPDVENLGPAYEEMEVLFYEHKLSKLPGLRMLRAWTPFVILSTARAADYMVRYCERAWRTSKPALGVDIGSTSVTMNVCRDGQPLTTIRSDMGIGAGLLGLLDQVELSQITRWLPYEITESEARDRLLNKAAYPRSIPQTREDLLLEQAAAREMLRLTLLDSLPGWPRGAVGPLQEPEVAGIAEGEYIQGSYSSGFGDERLPMIPPCEPIIASGGILARAPYKGHTALLLLDALQPTGISTLYLDEYNLVPSLGTVANINALAAVQALRNGGLTYLGTVIVPVGRARPGEKVLTIRPADRQSSISSDVTYGNLEVIPRQIFEPGTLLELTPARGVDIGRGPGKSLKVGYQGGSVGLIVDARGRPLVLADDPELQRRNMDYWLWEMMGP
jgi:hypothetical protein